MTKKSLLANILDLRLISASSWSLKKALFMIWGFCGGAFSEAAPHGMHQPETKNAQLKRKFAALDGTLQHCYSDCFSPKRAG